MVHIRGSGADSGAVSPFPPSLGEGGRSIILRWCERTAVRFGAVRLVELGLQGPPKLRKEGP